MKTSFAQGYFAALRDPAMSGMAIRVAIVVGTVLFTINHGAAWADGKMTRARWLSALLTYCVPYAVNIHGQYSTKSRHSLE